MEAPVVRPAADRSRARGAAVLLLVAAALAGPVPGRAQLPASSLAVRDDDGGTWWRSAAAPASWRGPEAAVARAVRWQELGPGLHLGTLDLDVNGGLLPLRIVVVRAALAQYHAELATRVEGGRAAWSLEHVPPDVDLAFNAGQFTEAAPWGWLVLDGRMRQAPSGGPLSAALAGTADSLTWLDARELPAAARRRWRFAFQSYPVLLRDGLVPRELRAPGRGVDVAHRDARLAIGRTGDTLLVVLSRYRMGLRVLERVPFGLTIPETAALLGALGARDAVMLDGGLSAQLLVRGADGTARTWPGARRVPVAMLLRARGPGADATRGEPAPSR
jgi:hypothetical protein